MIFYLGQDREPKFYKTSQIGQEDGQSEVEVTHYTEKVVCDECGAEYTDQKSIDLVKKWNALNDYAPCPNLSCHGEMAIVEVEDA